MVKAVRENYTAAKAKDLGLVEINVEKLKPSSDGLYGKIILSRI